MTTFAENYKDVAERIADFRNKHPEGCLRPADPAQPYRVEVIGDQTFIVYVAAAYRTPEDPCPGIGAAWEPYPGRTNFTRLSELQNAETSAWGRAIVAVLASESKHVASAEEVRNRQADHSVPDIPAAPRISDEDRAVLTDAIAALSEVKRSLVAEWMKQHQVPSLKRPGMTEDQANQLEAFLNTLEASE